LQLESKANRQRTIEDEKASKQTLSWRKKSDGFVQQFAGGWEEACRQEWQEKFPTAKPMIDKTNAGSISMNGAGESKGREKMSATGQGVCIGKYLWCRRYLSRTSSDFDSWGRH
jgi:hypothetical protein